MKMSTLRVWPASCLSELVTGSGISYGIVQPGSETPDGVPVVRVNNLSGNRVDLSDVKRVSPHIEAKYSRTRLHGGEVLLSLVGTLGLAAIAPPETKGWNVARAVGVLPFDSPELAYWVVLNLRSEPIQQFIRTRATTTVQATFNLRDVAQIPIPMPPENERKRFCEIAKAFDDKIELNRRMNETLETMARAIFKSWFVDFDPVRAKAEGRQPKGIPAHIADLFPNQLTDSPLGPIPKGWRVGPILEVAELLSGGTPKTSRPEYWNGSVPWASAKDVSQCGESFLIGTERSITELGLANSSTKLIPPKSTVIVARGATTGRMAMFGSEFAMNQTCYALASRDGTPYYLYCLLRNSIDALVNAAHGSVFDTITTSTFRSSGVILPHTTIAKAFEELTTSLFERLLVSLHESKTLASLRDTLLPKLLSGELQVGGTS